MAERTTTTTGSAAGDVADLTELTELTARLIDDPDDEAAERALPMARLRAATALGAVPAREPWPPVVDDPFPDIRGRLPEIGPSDLSADVVAGGILHHGAVIVRGMLSAPDVERFQQGIEQAFAAREAANEAADAGGQPDPSPWFTPFRPGRNTAGQRGKPHLVRLVDSPRVLRDVLATYGRLGLFDAISEYLGEPTVITANKSVLRWLETPRILPTDFHQDGRFMGGEARSVNVWVTLTGCHGDVPALDVVPRREAGIHPTGQGDSGFDWTLSAAEVVALAGDHGITRLDLEPGDGVLFDHLLVHRTGYEPTMRLPRLAIELWCFAPSHTPEQYQQLLV
jgi:hypothetical protein